MNKLIVFLMISILLYFLYKMRAYGGAYFDQTFNIKPNSSLEKRHPNYRETSVGDSNTIQKEYLSELTNINTRAPDLHYKLRLISNIFASSISYEDGMALINNLKSKNNNNEYPNPVYPEFSYIMSRIKSSTLPDGSSDTPVNVLKNKYPRFKNVIDNPNAPNRKMRISQYLNDILLTTDNPIHDKIKDILGVKDLRYIKSEGSYHGQISEKYNLCGFRATSPGLYESCINDAIDNQFMTRQCTEKFCTDGVGITPYRGYYEAFAREMHMNLITLEFSTVDEKNITLMINYRKPLIKDAPFIIITRMEGHVEPLYINFGSKTSDKNAYKILNQINKEIINLEALSNEEPSDPNRVISEIAKFIDNFHSFAGIFTLNTVYSQHTFDSIPFELGETQTKTEYSFDYFYLQVDNSYEEEVLKKAYELTKNRLSGT